MRDATCESRTTLAGRRSPTRSIETPPARRSEARASRRRRTCAGRAVQHVGRSLERGGGRAGCHVLTCACRHAGSRQAHLQARSSLTPPARRLAARASAYRRTCAGRTVQQIARARDERAGSRAHAHAGRDAACSRRAHLQSRSLSTSPARRRAAGASAYGRTCAGHGRRARELGVSSERPPRSMPGLPSSPAGGDRGG